MDYTEKKVVWFTGLSHGLCHAYALLFPAVLAAVMSEFRLSLTQVASLGTAFYFLFGIGALPAGAIGDRWSNKGVLALFLIGASLASLLVGYSKSVLAFGISLCLLGAFVSLYHPVGFSMVSQGVRERGKALGLHGIAGNVGLAVSPFLAGFIAARLSWRYVYYIMALPGLAVGIALLFSGLHYKTQPTHREESSPAFEKSINWPFLILLFAAMSLNGFLYQGTMTMLPIYLSDRIGYSSLPAIARGGLFTTVVLAIGAIGQYLGGRLSDRVRPARLYLSFYLLSLPFMALLGLAHNLPLVFLASAFAIFHFANQPVETTLLAESTPPSWRSRSYGVMFSMVFGFGSLSSALSGYVGENIGLPMVFFMLSGVIAIAVMIVFFLNRFPLRVAGRLKIPDALETQEV